MVIRRIPLSSSTRTASHKGSSITVSVAISIALIASALFVGATPASAAPCTTDQLKPHVHEVMINQGLGSYRPLVRGKQTLVRFFLSTPACAENQSIVLKDADLTITSPNLNLGASIPAEGTNATSGLLTTPLTLVPFSQAPAAGGAGSPLFVVSGNHLAPSATLSSFPITLSATLTYDAKVGDTVVATRTDNVTTVAGQSTPITATVEKLTNSAKVLLVPMGTNNRAVNDTAVQFSDKAYDATLDGLKTLARIFPVAKNDPASLRGLNDAGVRYELDKAALLDLPQAFRGTAPKKLFCGTDDFQTIVRPALANYLNNYNTNQRDAQGNPSVHSIADRVVGVVDQAISGTCAEGWAAIGEKESWIRARYKTSPTDTTNPVHSGAVLTMELSHSFGGVPCGYTTAALQDQQRCPSAIDRDNANDDFHSQLIHADATSRLRAYNTITKEYLDGAINPPTNRSVMKYRQQPAGWNNNTTLLEKSDWDLVFCKLGGPAVPECAAVPGQGASAATGGSASITYNISGSTNGTPQGTLIVDSFAAPGPTTTPLPESRYRLIQRESAGSSAISDLGIPMSQLISHHHDGGGSHGDSQLSEIKTFSVAFPVDNRTRRFELWFGSTLLRAWNRNLPGAAYVAGGDAPVIGPLTFTPIGPATPNETGGTKLSFDALATGTKVTSLSGVTFTETDTGTPRVAGDCLNPPIDEEVLAEIATNGELPPCRTPGTSTQSPPRSLRYNPRGALASVEDALEMTFDETIRTLRLYAGNGDGSTQATLTAFLEDGTTKTATASVGTNTTTLMQVEADTAAIERATLSYGSSVLGEEIDDLFFSKKPANVFNSYEISAQVTDDAASLDEARRDLKMTWFDQCPGVNIPLSTANAPVSVEEVPGNESPALFRATFGFTVDASRACGAGGDLLVEARVSDGVQTDSESSAGNPPAAPSSPPSAVISNPETVFAVLDHQSIPLSGQGHDPEDGVLPGDSLEWTVEGPGLASPFTATGGTAYLQPPEGDWPTENGQATYTVTLQVTDSDGKTDTDTRTVHILKDADGDFVPQIHECVGGSDTNPFDSFLDFDGDGVPGHSDPNPCVANNDHQGIVVAVDPPQINYPSTGGDFTLRFRLPYRSVNDVNGLSLRITEIGGEALLTPIPAKGYSSDGTLGTVKFDRQGLINYFTANPEWLNHFVWIGIEGAGSTTSGGTPWVFDAFGQTYVKRK